MYHFPFLLLLARLGCKYIRIVAKNMEYNFTSVKLGAATQLSNMAGDLCYGWRVWVTRAST